MTPPRIAPPAAERAPAHGSVPARRAGARGFTLLEIMVVMLIIGIMAGFAVLSVGGRSVDDHLQAESERLEKLMELAADEALFRSEQLGLLLETQGYRILVLGDQGWSPYVGGAALRPHAVPEPITMRLTVEGRPVATYAPQAAAPAEMLDETSGDAATEKDADQRPKPQIMVLSSGEMTPFTVDFAVPDVDSRYRVEGDLLGRVKSGRIDDDAKLP